MNRDEARGATGLDGFLSAVHARVRAQPFFHRLAVGTRLLLAVGFIPTGMVKVLGRRFTSMPPETPVGLFFEAMYQGGIYWQFLGASQILASVLLLIPATQLLGAIVFFPIILNIFVITIGYEFAGTGVITSKMLLASTFLLCWEYDRLRPLLWTRVRPVAAMALRAHRLTRVERIVYVTGGVAGMYFFSGVRGLAPVRALVWPSFAVAAACMLAAAALAVHAQVRDGRGTARAADAPPAPAMHEVTR